MLVLIPFLLISLIPVIWAIATYNTLVALRNHISESWSDVDTELQRRYELIPNLVETVKGYARHEQETLEQVITLRNQCHADHGSIDHQAGTEKQLVAGVQRLMAIAEDYPDLKADRNFLQLQQELVNTEDRIQAARRFYNGNVRDYRNKCEAFPSSLIANGFDFKPRDFFNVNPAVREAPAVKLKT
ncbi:LemA family protein [Pontiella agarivorans]|uniref:LemA family protein n=1 Tax=Pontiella agarivorans TaxID=3038953 RepID=A0ABU5MZE5_9BACT|nr:LemA family protein [Pontiella agarivorans]MDZ8119557.1 LemA family protein [Pontiella agarivorans]